MEGTRFRTPRSSSTPRARAKRSRRGPGNYVCRLCKGKMPVSVGAIGDDICYRCYQRDDSLSSCSDKQCYASEADAQVQADELNANTVLRLYDSSPYYCRKHRGFHVGHHRPLEERQRRGRMLREIYRKASK